MKKENGKKLKSKVLVGAMACLMALTMAGCGQEEEEEKSFSERVEDEVFPDHEEVKSAVEDELISGLHESLYGDEAEGMSW